MFIIASAIIVFAVMYAVLDIFGFFPWSTLYGCHSWQKKK